MSKYYAVKVGRTTGIFESWEECSESVTGYPGALYKSFKSITDAYAYMGWEGTQLSLFDSPRSGENVQNSDDAEILKAARTEDMPYSDSRHAVAYVDGSYNVETKIYSYGIVMFFDGREIHLSDRSNDPELSLMRNVAGEIEGAMTAMNYALKKGCRELTIYHDYEGIAKWPLGIWKTNKPGTVAYKKFYDSLKKQLKVNFVKVTGHSGVYYNEMADALAKKAAGNAQ